MRAVVFVNGRVTDYAILARQLRAGDYLIGADGGTQHILALGLQPAVVVGDLDSLPARIVDRLAAQGVPVERHPPAKDKTDLELAIERAVRDGAQEAVIVGAVGGRLDQTLANLLILARRTWAIPLSLVEGNQVAHVVRSGERFQLEGPVGSIVSALPLSPIVRGITYTGLAYPLQDATLVMGSTRGVSNELVEPPATIQVGEGILLIVHTLESGDGP